MEKRGVVVKIEGELATLNVVRAASCGDKCASCKSRCEVPTIQVQVANTLNARPGDRVQVGLSSRQLIGSTFLLYTVPLFSFVVGLLFGLSVLTRWFSIDGELLGLLAGFFAMGVSYFLIHRMSTGQEDILKMTKKL